MPLRSVGLAHCTVKLLVRLHASGAVVTAVGAAGALRSSLISTGNELSMLPALSTE